MSSRTPEFRAVDVGRTPVDLSDIARKHNLFPESTPIRFIHCIKEHAPTFTIVMRGHYGISFGSITVDHLSRALRKIGFDLYRRRPACATNLMLDLDDVRLLAFGESLTEDTWYLARKQVAEALLNKYNITFKDDADDR